MTKSERREIVTDLNKMRPLYEVESLHRALNELGYQIEFNDLYVALKATGWVKLRLIRDRLLDIKRELPKKYPFDGVRHLVKAPLLVSRDADLPGWDADQRLTQ